jgi:prepilin-type N-terminal cleavage/methylation domain-containing protein
MMMKAAAKGFTLIELAIVIAIIAILASVAIPRFAALQDNANRAVAQNFLSQLTTAAATATAEAARVPTQFTEFVTTAPASVGAVSTAPFRFNISTPQGVNGGAAPCATVAANAITCAGWAGQLGTVTYTLGANGQITAANAGALKL